MGCFDTVHFKCPYCGNDEEVQSKAGECRLADYDAGAVPAAIAVSIGDGTTRGCSNCGGVFSLRAYVPEYVPVMVVKEAEPYSDTDEDEDY